MNLFYLFILLLSQNEITSPEEIVREGEPFSITAGLMVTNMEDDGYYLYLSEGVEIVHGTAVITGDSGFANQNTGLIEVIGNVKIDDKGTVITSEMARYWKEEKIAETIGNSHLVTSTQEITAHRLSYFRIEVISAAYDNVVMKDRESNTVLKGDTGVYFLETDYGIIFGNPNMISVKGNDTLFVSGDTMENYADSGYYVVTNNVLVQRGTTLAVAGKLYYYPEQEKIDLFEEHPRIDNENAQLWGDSLIIWMDKDEISKIEAWSNAGCNYNEDNVYNYINGNILFLYFNENKPRLIEVSGEVNGQYIIKEESDENEGIEDREP